MTISPGVDLFSIGVAVIMLLVILLLVVGLLVLSAFAVRLMIRWTRDLEEDHVRVRDTWNAPPQASPEGTDDSRPGETLSSS